MDGWALTKEQRAALESDLAAVEKKHGRQKPKRTKATIKKTITQAYKAQYTNVPWPKVKITHNDPSDEILKKLFIDESPVNITVETLPDPSRTRSFSDKIRLDNLDQVAQDNYHLFDGDAIVRAAEGIKYIKVTLPPYIPFHKAGQMLTAQGHQLKACNPWMIELDINDWLVHVYEVLVRLPYGQAFPFHTLEGIAKEVMANGTKPVLTQAKFLYNPDYDLTEAERKQVLNELLGKEKANKTLEKLKVHYKEGMAKKELARLAKVGVQTVRKHWENLAA